MTPQEQFDDLVRRKLEERSFAFDEAHWQQAQQAIAASKRRRRGGYWLGTVVVLLVAGIAAWWLWPEASVPQNVTVAHEQGAPLSVVSDEERSSPNVSADGEIVEHSGTSTDEARSPALERNNNGPYTEADAAAARTPRKSGDGQASARGTQGATNASHQPAQAVSAQPATQPKGLSDGYPSRMSAETDPIKDTPADAPIHSPEDLEDVALAKGPIDAVQGMGNDQVEPTGPVQPGAAGERIEQAGPSAEMTDAVVDEAHANEAGSNADPLGDEDSIDNGPQDGTDADEAVREGERAANDTSAAESAAIDVALLTPVRKPWEVGVLGGLFSSTTQYGGNQAEVLREAARPDRSYQVGAELMHMGRHFGIGTGVYHGTHTERLDVAGLSRTDIAVQHFWYLVPVDTSLLFITDTIELNGQPHYVGQTINTTINVITPGTDTSVSTTSLRAARVLVNRVSYVEVPLLLDAHLVQGRWTFGLRGGPTLGLLTARRVTLPAEDDGGYSELGSEAFRRMVAGYTARAYIRYRWNAAWSVGIEPALRGQWMNSLSQDGLERRAHATGVMMSLTYRLR